MQHYTFKDKEERRRFLKNTRNGAGAVGLGALLSGLGMSDPVFARLEAKYTYQHVADLIDKIKSSDTPSGKTQLSFEQSLDNINQLILDENETALKTVQQITDFLTSLNLDDFGSDRNGLLGLPVGLSDSLVGAYLAGIGRFKFGEYETNELLRSFELIKPLETDFLPNFAKQIQLELLNNPDLAAKFSDIGRPAIVNALSRIKSEDETQSRFIDPVTGAWIIIGVVVVVVAVFAVIFGEKQ